MTKKSPTKQKQMKSTQKLFLRRLRTLATNQLDEFMVIDENPQLTFPLQVPGRRQGSEGLTGQQPGYSASRVRDGDAPEPLRRPFPRLPSRLSSECALISGGDAGRWP